MRRMSLVTGTLVGLLLLGGTADRASGFCCGCITLVSQCETNPANCSLIQSTCSGTFVSLPTGACLEGVCQQPPVPTPTATPPATPTATPRGVGESCADPSQCASTFCVDGVCCDRACDGPRQQCNLPGRAGTCAEAAVAPALTPLALLVAVGLLSGAAALALRRRRPLA